MVCGYLSHAADDETRGDNPILCYNYVVLIIDKSFTPEMHMS